MKRAILALIGCGLAAVVMVATASAAGGAANGMGGGAGGITPAVAGNVNFDNIIQPDLFDQTTRLYKLDGVTFSGGGAVLNEGGSFGVTGYSSPNFLAFNCNASTEDPGTARLPETISLGGVNHTAVSLKVGSAASAGAILRLHATRNGGGAQDRLVTLGTAMQTVSFSIPVKAIKITTASGSPVPGCVLVVDDLHYS
jgi:hypothetical protein